MIRELDRVVLTTSVPALGLEAGDIGTVVLVHDGGAGFEVEFVKLDGETHAVTTLSSDAVVVGVLDTNAQDTSCIRFAYS